MAGAGGTVKSIYRRKPQLVATAVVNSDDLPARALALHRQLRGKIRTTSAMSVKSREELSLLYTPGVAAACKAIQADHLEAYASTIKSNTIAVISDGSAVLGLGNIGPLAGLPVMEGKALLMKEFAGINSFPLVIDTQDTAEIIQFVKQVSPTFAGINLEDISAPRCFAVEEALQDIGIPVFHDDQHGTAIVVMAALINAAKVVKKDLSSMKVVIIGAGAAGLAVAKMLLGLECRDDTCELLPNVRRVADVIVLDKQGALLGGRPHMNVYKQAVAGVSNKERRSGQLIDVIAGADAIIGVSGPGSITEASIRLMAKDPIVFAMANPTPEIMPAAATAAGAAVVATGRSDYANQINNVLAFPGIFKAVVDGRLQRITPVMKLAAVEALAGLVPHPTADHIIADPFTPKLAQIICTAVLAAQ